MAETVLVKDIEIWSRGFSVFIISLLSSEENVQVLLERSFENTRTESNVNFLDDHLICGVSTILVINQTYIQPEIGNSEEH